jgi:glycosyltransferase involved in cell wall biosynthesis
MHKRAYRRATKEMLDSVKRVLVRSESLRRGIVDLGCDEDKIDIVRTGIPLEEFSFRERSVPEDGEWRLMQAGRLIEKKGLPTTLRAFAQFSARYPKSTITIAGEGPMLQELQALARELKIDNRTTFAGFVSQDKIRELYYASHIFLHPSVTGRDGNQEGVPNSMLEAMASGLPVFATHHGGIPEAIENGISGVLVAEHDCEALANALIETVQDRHLLAQLGRIGSQSVGEKFDQRVQTRRLENIYLREI